MLVLYEVEWDEDIIEDRHAGTMGQLMLLVKGTGYAQFGTRKDFVGDRPTIFNAFDLPVPFKLRGPWKCFGASFSPLGWAALTQAPVSQYSNGFLPANLALGRDIDEFSSNITARRARGEISAMEACAELADWLRPRFQSIPSKHEAVINKTLAWLASSLNPAPEKLVTDPVYSRRQIERLVYRYFGFTPSALARKFRAVRAASLLGEANLTDEGEAEIADAFHDQPHMIREIRRFCGYTPTRLGGAGEPMFQQLLRLKNLNHLKQYDSIG